MKVTSEPLPGDLPIEALRAANTCDQAGIHAGELVGYRCTDCDAVDETLRQIVHEEGCDLCGEHGRALYDDELPHLEADLESPELTTDHPITVFYAGFSDRDGDLKNGHVVAFRCDECGNADEDLFELVHDENCSLAGRWTGDVGEGEGEDGRAVAGAPTP